MFTFFTVFNDPDVFLIFCVTVVVNRYNILYTSYSSIFTIFYTTFWETSIKRSVGSFPRVTA